MSDLMDNRVLMETQCKATSKQSGERCKRRPIPGGTVCIMHGGGTRKAQQAAKLRILEAADPVAAELIRIALYGDSDSVRVQAAKDILSRAGLDATQRLEADVTHHNDSDVDRRLEELIEAAKHDDLDKRRASPSEI